MDIQGEILIHLSNKVEVLKIRLKFDQFENFHMIQTICPSHSERNNYYLLSIF